MISPTEIPQLTMDLTALKTAAQLLLGFGSTLPADGSAVDAAWARLVAGYDAPEAAALVSASLPVVTATATVGSDLLTIGAALSAYADAVQPIKERLTDLQVRAHTFVDGVAGDQDWQLDHDKVDRHNELLHGVDAAVQGWNDAERDCANRIDALFGGTVYRVTDGDGVDGADEHGYTADQLDRAAEGDSGLPWGGTEDNKYGFWGGVGQFFVGVVEGVWSGVQGLAAFTGLEGGEAFTNAWSGLGALTGLQGGDKAAAAWGGMWKGLTAWDEWKKNPGKALGLVVSNFIDPTHGGAKVAKTAAAAAHGGLEAAKFALGGLKNGGKDLAESAAKHPTLPHLPEPGKELSPAHRAAHQQYLESLRDKYPEDFERLRRDADKNGKINPGADDEGLVALDLRERGIYDADIDRPTQAGRGDFYSPSSGQAYDHKGVHSEWPPFSTQIDKSLPYRNGFDPNRVDDLITTLNDQIGRGRTPVLDLRNANQAAVDSVRKAVAAKGLDASVIFYP